MMYFHKQIIRGTTCNVIYTKTNKNKNYINTEQHGGANLQNN